MEVLPEEIGDSTPAREESEGLVVIEGGGLDSPKVRRSARKKSSRSLTSRGRLAKSGPKLPLMRMAEMRKGGLRGRALRHSGKKGLDGKDKGLKALVGRGLQVLTAILEYAVLVGALGGEGSVAGGDGVDEGVQDGDVAVMMEDRGSGDVGDPIPLGSPIRRYEGGCSKQPWQKELVQVGTSSDLVLDLMSAQPLQAMGFIGEHVSSVVAGDFLMLEGIGDDRQVKAPGSAFDEEFPMLSKESLKIPREKERNRGIGGKEGPRGADQPITGYLDTNKEGQSGVQGSMIDGNRWFGGKNYKASLADGGFARGNLPVSFEPEKIRKMGVAGESSGLPSIHFSGVETSYLAEKMGYAVVGKFSHSIPSSLHLQRAFQGMKFLGEFSWKYINAKHVLIQFHLVDDYAKLLSGPNGMSVCFVDRHPMRVFKWTPDFDPFFESPIAAVWCNFIGLPIHLFEKSALFAIVCLLGEPLQVDHATISRSRFSFARLCIEIDISKTSVGEIILDLQGREVRQVVKWDRIPLYCHDCKHVGHSRDVCYANGQREKPTRRDYTAAGKGPRFEEGRLGNKGDGEGLGESAKELELGAVSPGPSAGKLEGLVRKGFMEHDGGEFQLQGRRHGKQGSRFWDSTGLGRESSGEGGKGVVVGLSEGKGGGVPPGSPSENRFSILSSFSREPFEGSPGALEKGFHSGPQYMKMLPNGDFDAEAYEDEKDWDCEYEIEGVPRLLLEHSSDKRGATTDLEKSEEVDNRMKKGRLEVVTSSAVV